MSSEDIAGIVIAVVFGAPVMAFLWLGTILMARYLWGEYK